MRIYKDHIRASYFAPLDILYVVRGSNSLDCCHTIEETPSGVAVMYNDDGDFAGAEIYGLARHVSSLPAEICIDANNPFKIAIHDAIGYSEEDAMRTVDDFVWSDAEQAVHEWGSGIYYNGVKAYQRQGGRMISPTSYEAFGADMFQAREAYGRWLEVAKEAYEALKP